MPKYIDTWKTFTKQRKLESVLIVLIVIAGIILLTQLSLRAAVEYKSALQISFDTTKTIVEKLSVSPTRRYIKQVKPGEVLIDRLQFKYSGNTDHPQFAINTLDFDFNHDNCDDQHPKIDSKGSNSVPDWVDYRLLGSNNGEATVEIRIRVPEDVAQGTYWFAPTLTNLSTTGNKYDRLSSLYYITVGDNNSEKCVS